MFQTHPWFLDNALQLILEGNKQLAGPIRVWRQANGLEGRDPYFLRLALSAEPAPLTVDIILEREPYVAAALFAQMLAETADRGFLTAVSDGYRLTDHGRTLVAELPAVYRQASQSIMPIDAVDCQTLVELLNKLVAASLASPIEHPILDRLCFFSQPQDAPLFTQVRDGIMALWGFRDDAHLASWQHLPVSPIAWESLTLLWQEKGKTAVSLAEAFTHRGHDEPAYRTALQELVDLGWAQPANDQFLLTDDGRGVREEAEKATDEAFYSPWQCLTTNEVDQLQTTLGHFCQALAAQNQGDHSN